MIKAGVPKEAILNSFLAMGMDDEDENKAIIDKLRAIKERRALEAKKLEEEEAKKVEDAKKLENTKDTKNEDVLLGNRGENEIAAKRVEVVVDSERKGGDDVVELKKEVNEEE